MWKNTDNNLFWHKLWIDNGRPKQGVVFQMQCQSRHEYHYAVKWLKHKDEKNNLSELLLNDNLNKFWRVIRLEKNKKDKVSNIVDNDVGSHDICNLLKKYKSLYSSVPYDEKAMKHV